MLIVLFGLYDYSLMIIFPEGVKSARTIDNTNHGSSQALPFSVESIFMNQKNPSLS